MAVKKKTRPSGVPKDYIVQLSKVLSGKGLELSTEKIRRVLRGKISDIDLTKAVADGMVEIRNVYRAKQKELKKLRSHLKKG